MHRYGWVLAFAGGLWLAGTAVAPEGLAERGACSMRPSGHKVRACRVEGVARSRRRSMDIHLGQPVHRGPRLLYPPRAVSDVYWPQTVRRSEIYVHRGRTVPWRRRQFAWRIPQIPPPFRVAVRQPWPESITRPCYSRFADPLACVPWRVPADPFVDALLESPNPRTAPILRALGLPIILNVPPIVTINND